MSAMIETENPKLAREHSLMLLREMLRIRRFEEKCVELYSLGKIHGFLHLYIGEEAVAAGLLPALERDLDRADPVGLDPRRAHAEPVDPRWAGGHGRPGRGGDALARR